MSEVCVVYMEGWGPRVSLTIGERQLRMQGPTRASSYTKDNNSEAPEQTAEARLLASGALNIKRYKELRVWARC